MKKLLYFSIAIIITFSLMGCGNSNNSTNSNEQSVNNVSDILQAFKDNDLTVDNSKKMESSDFGMAPYVADEAYIFAVQNDMNARVFKVSNSDDLNSLKSYYDDLGKQSALFYSYTYSKGSYLIQMNGEISSDTFQKYEDVMNKIIK